MTDLLKFVEKRSSKEQQPTDLWIRLIKHHLRLNWHTDPAASIFNIDGYSELEDDLCGTLHTLYCLNFYNIAVYSETLKKTVLTQHGMNVIPKNNASLEKNCLSHFKLESGDAVLKTVKHIIGFESIVDDQFCINLFLDLKLDFIDAEQTVIDKLKTWVVIDSNLYLTPRGCAEIEKRREK